MHDDHAHLSCADGALCKGDFVQKLELLIIQPTPFCNIDCKYCYLFGRDQKAVMSDAVLETTIRNLFSSILLGPEVTICWHAGEPLVAPLRFFERTVELVNKYNVENVEVRYDLQTNGILLTQEFCDFATRNDVKIGLSIDGPKDIHDLRRRFRNGTGTFDHVMNAVELLKKNKLDFHIISVIHKATLRDPDGFYDFFEKLSPRVLGLNIEEIEGPNKEHQSLSDDDAEALQKFLMRLATRWRNANYTLSIREFNSIAEQVLHYNPNRPASTQDSSAFSIITVDHKGDFSTFSPELHAAPAPEFNNFILGNVGELPYEEAVYTPTFRRLYQEINDGKANCAVECEYYNLCGGGCASNKFFENCDLSSTTTRACRFNKMAPIDAVLNLEGSA